MPEIIYERKGLRVVAKILKTGFSSDTAYVSETIYRDAMGKESWIPIEVNQYRMQLMSIAIGTLARRVKELEKQIEEMGGGS